MSSDADINANALQLLGEIKGIVSGLKDGQAIQNAKIDSMDARLRAVEQRSAAVGAVSGGVMAVGVALLIETIKGWIGKGGPAGP